MKYATKQDISIAIQCLQRLTEKKFPEQTKLKLIPPLNRVIMELEELNKNG
jgi:hypothetical protein